VFLGERGRDTPLRLFTLLMRVPCLLPGQLSPWRNVGPACQIPLDPPGGGGKGVGPMSGEWGGWVGEEDQGWWSRPRGGFLDLSVLLSILQLHISPLTDKANRICIHGVFAMQMVSLPPHFIWRLIPAQSSHRVHRGFRVHTSPRQKKRREDILFSCLRYLTTRLKRLLCDTNNNTEFTWNNQTYSQ
jgi:hypothetical protein